MIHLQNIENLQALHGAASTLEFLSAQLKRKTARAMYTLADTSDPTAEQIANWKAKFDGESEDLNAAASAISSIWNSEDAVEIETDDAVDPT